MFTKLYTLEMRGCSCRKIIRGSKADFYPVGSDVGDQFVVPIDDSDEELSRAVQLWTGARARSVKKCMRTLSEDCRHVSTSSLLSLRDFLDEIRPNIVPAAPREQAPRESRSRSPDRGQMRKLREKVKAEEAATLLSP